MLQRFERDYNLRPRKLFGCLGPNVRVLLRAHCCQLLCSELQYETQTRSIPEVPVDLILLIAEYCPAAVVLTLSQTCLQLRRLFAGPQLRQLGILKSGPTATEIHLVGGPFSAANVSLLRHLTCHTPQMYFITDLYHVTTFLCDIRLFLRMHAINSFEITLLDDEHCILDGPDLSGSLLNVLSHLSHHCNILRFISGAEHKSRPLQWVPIHVPKPTHQSIGKALMSIKEIRLSSSLFHLRSFNGLISILLWRPTITSLTLECSTASESEDILSRTHLPALEYLSIRANDATLVNIPDAFSRSHSTIRFIYLSALFPWETQSFTPSRTSIALPLQFLASLTISSKYAAFNVLASPSFLDLHVYSFMAFPVPQNRGYCDVVRSLVDIWLRSKAFRPVNPTHFTASFTFPRRLSDHLAFCKEVPVYQCSCTAASLHGKKVHGIQRVKIFLDHLNDRVVVCLSYSTDF